MDKRKFCVTKDYTIVEVMRVFKRNRERGVVVIGERGQVCGFVSMGDIIYALIDGKNMYSHIGQVCNSSVVYLREKNYKKALEIFQSRNISLIPILNDDMELVDVITAREMFDMVDLK